MQNNIDYLQLYIVEILPFIDYFTALVFFANKKIFAMHVHKKTLENSLKLVVWLHLKYYNCECNN